MKVIPNHIDIERFPPYHEFSKGFGAIMVLSSLFAFAMSFGTCNDPKASCETISQQAYSEVVRACSGLQQTVIYQDRRLDQSNPKEIICVTHVDYSCRLALLYLQATELRQAKIFDTTFLANTGSTKNYTCLGYPSSVPPPSKK